MTEPTARELLSDLSARRVSARELLDAAAARAEATSALGAVVATDLERARAAAGAIDEARAQGTELGPLAGLPMTIKDAFDVTGLPAVAGNPALVGRDPEVPDADLVATVRAAGAVPWAKTNTPFMCADVQTFNDVYGTTRNPFDPERTSGGSSGGAAVALATGVTSLEIGSDIGGSLRVPAGYCGVHALKPTWGRLSLRGHIPPLPGTPYTADEDLGVGGPMARSAGDLRLLWEVLAGRSTAPTPATGLRVALWLDDPVLPLAAEVRTVLERAAEALRGQGVVVEIAAPPVDVDELIETYFGLLFPITASGFPESLLDRMRAQRPGALAAVAAGASRYREQAAVVLFTSDEEAVLAARGRRARMQRAVGAWFERYDAILAPITPVPAIPHTQTGSLAARNIDVDGASLPYLHLFDRIALATALHLPAVAAPAGRTVAGLPVGAQLIGPPDREDRLFDLADALEQALGPAEAPPRSW
ncbi:amidase family protein [Pseudonocardia sp. CA-107938]|uniref:amidase family protein n=1 Tax=Pseudonocardia sp. CA-107938 TaxID=3240021 RepID=UPI003D9034F6